jgi:hypothetical protein
MAVEPSRNPCHLIGLAARDCMAVEPSGKGEQACAVHRLKDYLRVPRRLDRLATQDCMAHSRVPLRSRTAVGPSWKGEQACVVHLPAPSHRLNMIRICARVLLTEERRRGLSHGPLPSRSADVTTVGEMGVVLPLLIVCINQESHMMTVVAGIIATMMKDSSRSHPTHTRLIKVINHRRAQVGDKHGYPVQDGVPIGTTPTTPDVHSRASTMQ